MIDPIAHWKLDGDATDLKGNNNGTLSTPTILHDLDNTINVVSVQTATFSINNSTFQENVAINVYRAVAGNSTNLGWDVKFIEQDLTGKKINFYLYFKDQETLDKFTQFQIYIHGRLDLLGGGDGWNVYFWKTGGSQPAPQIGWNVYSLDADNPDGIESGGADLTTCDKVRVRLWTSDTAETFAEGDIICDYLVMDTPMKTKDRNGIDNKAYYFIPDSSISVTNDSSIDITSAISISMWVKLDRLPEDMDATFPGFLGHGSKFTFWFSKADNRLHWKFRDSANNNYDGDVNSNVLVANTWYHFVFTFDEDIARGYQDGEEVDSIDVAESDLLTANADLFLGRGDSGGFLEGVMDDVRIYNVALNDGEVKELYSPTPDKNQLMFGGKYAESKFGQVLGPKKNIVRALQ